MKDRMTELQNKCSNAITDLFKKYENNGYMCQRIYTHIVNILPNALENESKNNEKRINRNNYLSEEQQVFIQVFLSKNQYFYLPNNNLFYEYNGKNYYIVKEDDIIHKLLSSISSERILLQWKHKTKINIIKLIKERTLFSSIPDTDTIQNVLNVLYPSIFSSKNTAKYFLTIVGDNILKKNPHLVFLVSTQMKKLLIDLDNIAFGTIGNVNAIHNFITKYHENHTYDNCRLIKINDSFSIDIWKDILKKIGLDLLCVAAHYSKRYENSDKFIETKSDEELKFYTYYLKNTSQKEIVQEFCSKYIVNTETFQHDNSITNSNGTNDLIEWKNLHFIWKQFLSTYNLPNMMYSNNLKNLLKEKYQYDETTDSFMNITSMYLPIQLRFIKFWETTITIKNDNPETYLSQECELEIEELYSLFKLWTKQKTDSTINIHNVNINEENILKIIKHFFPHIEIIEDKYILNICCSLWDKASDIDNSFLYIKEEIKNNCSLALISFDDAYNYYYKFCNMNSLKLIVSKMYFEKYLYYKLTDYIVYEKFIETKLFLHLFTF